MDRDSAAELNQAFTQEFRRFWIGLRTLFGLNLKSKLLGITRFQPLHLIIETLLLL